MEDVALTPEEEEELIELLTEIVGDPGEVSGMGSTYLDDLRASNCILLDYVFDHADGDRALIVGLLAQLVDDIKQEGVTSDKVSDAWTYWITNETSSNQDICALWRNLSMNPSLTWISDIALRLMALVASEASAERVISHQRRLIMKGMYNILPDLFEARSCGILRTVIG